MKNKQTRLRLYNERKKKKIFVDIYFHDMISMRTIRWEITPTTLDLNCGRTVKREITPATLDLNCGRTAKREITPATLDLNCGVSV